MAPELSSNWKKLQATINADSSSAKPKPQTPASSKSTPTRPSNKRKLGDSATHFSTATHSKKQKVSPKEQQTASHQPRSTSHSKQMGVTQSSALTKGTAQTITPSLALWAEDHDISPEDLAEAYNLGPKPHPRSTSRAPLPLPPPSTTSEDRRRVNEGLAPGLELGKYVALDCEMVGVGPEGRQHALARVSLVDFHGRQVYDAYVRPQERVVDFRTAITGIAPATLRSARPFAEAQRDVAALLKDRVVVGHDLRHDLAALELTHPAPLIRDTARFGGYRRYGHGPKPALRVLAREVLGVEIQGGQHSSVEDARVAMLLFRRRKSDFDVEHASRYGAETGGEKGKGKGSSGGGKKKKKKR
ncbi:ribonuclease H-like domain-containing protein [Xylariaceae sp. FL0016]|nr:ribonuclease H-like domain-containing protein [Xylariaceae sp. FL0016]